MIVICHLFPEVHDRWRRKPSRLYESSSDNQPSIVTLKEYPKRRTDLMCQFMNNAHVNNALRRLSYVYVEGHHGCVSRSEKQRCCRHSKSWCFQVPLLKTCLRSSEGSKCDFTSIIYPYQCPTCDKCK